MHSGENLLEVLPSSGGEDQPKHKGWQHVLDGVVGFVAGSIGAVASVYTGQPLDTVKVKLQTFPHLYKSSVECFMQTLRTDGIRRGLYAGTVPALAANVAENAVLFAGFEFCKKAVAAIAGKKDVNSLNPVQNACAGSLAAVFSTFALCPTELVKCRLQAAKEMHAQQAKAHATSSTTLNKTIPEIGPWTLCREIFRTDGFLGFFKGFWPTFAREVPGYFFFFGGYELSRYLLTPAGKTKDEIGTFRTVLCGGIGGVSLWVVIFPADVVKSRVQVKGHGNLFGTMVDIIRKEGPMALYSGLGPTVIRTFFATGALFVAYENTKKLMHGLTMTD